MPRVDYVVAGAHVNIPNISQDDLISFHEAHFSEGAAFSFGSTFILPPEGQHGGENPIYDGWEEEDDRGYYEDGVKRTLTDEQIEIFRHSELEALRKEREKQAEAASKAATSSDETANASDEKAGPSRSGTPSSNLASSSRVNKKKKKKGPKRGRAEPKPDLRKRTWDVVDKGLDTLEYD